MRGKGSLALVLMMISLTIVISLALLTHVPSPAEEIRYPVPSYEGKELEKVRQWEKNWVWKKIDPTNIDQVKEFVPESLYQIIKDPETWGESWFEIVPYREIEPTKGELKFTNIYKGMCSIGPNEELLNYVCGIPFPNPKTGLEIAYNFDNLNQGDNKHAFEEIMTIDGKRSYDRKMAGDTWYLYFLGRREIPPLPKIFPNNKRIFKAFHIEYHEPGSMRGTRLLSIKFIDHKKPYEQWSWSSSTRKLVRQSTAQRTDTQGGGDGAYDDYMGYDFYIPAMNYKHLGRKEVLLARHQDIDRLKKGHREGYCLFNGIQRERVNTYIVECIHKNPNYVYSKQIWYVDPETWRIIYADKYDRKGKLLRVFDIAGYGVKSIYNGALIGAIGFILIIDVQRLHSTGGFLNITIGETDKYHQQEYYTPKALQKYGY